MRGAEEAMTDSQEQEAQTPPRVFVSYSWTSKGHEADVVELCTRLTSDGVHVVLDKWDLSEGQGKYEFMEQMVTDPNVHRVLMICDAQYARKADRREGGVGEESMIISPKVYGSAEQTKFLPLLWERAPDGTPCVPTFISGRLFVDFSAPAEREAAYEKLLRNIFGRPEFSRPPIGQPPSYITDEDPVEVFTDSRARRLLNLAENAPERVPGALADYLAGYSAVLAEHRWEPEVAAKFALLDDEVVADIERFGPYRNEWLRVVQTLAHRRLIDDAVDQIHGFFEQAASLFGRRTGESQWSDAWVDNLTFLVRELFVLTVASLVQNESFRALGRLLDQPYFIRGSNGGDYHSFEKLDRRQASLESMRNQRLQLNRVSVAADMLKERCDQWGPPFPDVIEAETLLFVRSVLDLHRPDVEDSERFVRYYWHPWSYVYESLYSPNVGAQTQECQLLRAIQACVGRGERTRSTVRG